MGYCRSDREYVVAEVSDDGRYFRPKTSSKWVPAKNFKKFVFTPCEKNDPPFKASMKCYLHSDYPTGPPTEYDESKVLELMRDDKTTAPPFKMPGGGVEHIELALVGQLSPRVQHRMETFKYYTFEAFPSRRFILLPEDEDKPAPAGTEQAWATVKEDAPRFYPVEAGDVVTMKCDSGEIKAKRVSLLFLFLFLFLFLSLDVELRPIALTHSRTPSPSVSLSLSLSLSLRRSGKTIAPSNMSIASGINALPEANYSVGSLARSSPRTMSRRIAVKLLGGCGLVHLFGLPTMGSGSQRCAPTWARSTSPTPRREHSRVVRWR